MKNNLKHLICLKQVLRHSFLNIKKIMNQHNKKKSKLIREQRVVILLVCFISKNSLWLGLHQLLSHVTLMMSVMISVRFKELMDLTVTVLISHKIRRDYPYMKIRKVSTTTNNKLLIVIIYSENSLMKQWYLSIVD